MGMLSLSSTGVVRRHPCTQQQELPYPQARVTSKVLQSGVRTAAVEELRERGPDDAVN
jgi:hypothetical protein